jgi:cysteate synthase
VSASYTIRCRGCDATYADDGEILMCANGCTALLVSDYDERSFQPDAGVDGTFRYHRWLPVRRRFAGTGTVAVFRADAWGAAYGLTDLWFAFSGFWPERGASLETATFKELEAYAVLGRLPDDEDRTLVVASAGNTAAAFARACSKYGRRCAIVVPGTALPRLRFVEPLAPCVAIVEVDGTYDNAIVFARKLAALPGFVLEGGVRNVARRDGMGTVMLAAAERIGRLPDAYVQAVGSGAGALAANEAAGRLVRDGRFGTTRPRLLLSQNRPFTPMVDSWADRSATLRPLDAAVARERIAAIGAQVLSNQTPPYAVPGGVREALAATDGEMFGIDNQHASESAARFLAMEGIDLEPAAAVALASLPAVASALDDRDRCVLLHLTGGGWERFRAPLAAHEARPAVRVSARETESSDALERVRTALELRPALA